MNANNKKEICEILFTKAYINLKNTLININDIHVEAKWTISKIDDIIRTGSILSVINIVKIYYDRYPSFENILKKSRVTKKYTSVIKYVETIFPTMISNEKHRFIISDMCGKINQINNMILDKIAKYISIMIKIVKKYYI